MDGMQEVATVPARRRAAHTWLRRAAMPGLLFLITVGFFWKLTLTGQFTWLNQPDLVNEVLPSFQFQASEWHAGHFPLWDPYVLAGQPMLGRVQPGVGYPLNWILFWMPFHDGKISRLALNWYFVFIHFMAALFCYLLCRDLRRSRSASLLAGAAFGLGGYMGTTDWPQMINGAVWAPLVFLFFLRAMRGDRVLPNAALAGAFLGISFLSGHHQAPTFVALAVGGTWLYYAMQERKQRLLLAGAAAVFGLQVLLVGALQILPATEYGRLSLRFVNATNPVFWNQKVPYSVHWFYSLFPTSVLGIVIPGMWRSSNPYIGLVIVTLAFAGVYALWNERLVRFWTALLIGALFFALGGYAVFHGILYSIVPMVEKARTPAMAILLFHLAITVLAAYGLDACREAAALDSIWTGRIVRVLLGMSALIYSTLFVATRFRTEQSTEYDDVAVAALAALLLAALLHAWKRRAIASNTAIACAFLLMLFELGTVTGANYFHRETSGGDLHSLDENGDIVAYLKAQPQPLRLEVHEDQRPINFGDWNGVEQFRGFSPVTANIAYLQAEPRSLLLFGLNYALARKPDRPSQVEVLRGASGLNLYRNPEAFPRVWSVHEVRELHAKSEILPLLHDESFDLRHRAFLMGSAPALETCADADNVRLLSHEPTRVVIQADMRCRGMVLLGDTFFPGWQATVDGRPAPLYEAYTAIRGVVVGAGSQRIEMRYRPRSVYWGAALTCVGLLLTAAWTWRSRSGS